MQSKAEPFELAIEPVRSPIASMPFPSRIEADKNRTGAKNSCSVPGYSRSDGGFYRSDPINSRSRASENRIGAGKYHNLRLSSRIPPIGDWTGAPVTWADPTSDWKDPILDCIGPALKGNGFAFDCIDREITGNQGGLIWTSAMERCTSSTGSLDTCCQRML